MAEQLIVVAKTHDVPVGEFKSVEVQGKRLLVCHTESGFYAVDDTCTHDDGPLADGWLEGNAIECPRHGARFDVRTGKVVCLPAILPIPTYVVKVEGPDVFVAEPVPTAKDIR